jgi:hypothetical protein
MLNLQEKKSVFRAVYGNRIITFKKKITLFPDAKAITQPVDIPKRFVCLPGSQFGLTCPAFYGNFFINSFDGHIEANISGQIYRRLCLADHGSASRESEIRISSDLTTFFSWVARHRRNRFNRSSVVYRKAAETMKAFTIEAKQR